MKEPRGHNTKLLTRWIEHCSDEKQKKHFATIPIDVINAIDSLVSNSETTAHDKLSFWAVASNYKGKLVTLDIKHLPKL